MIANKDALGFNLLVLKVFEKIDKVDFISTSLGINL